MAGVRIATYGMKALTGLSKGFVKKKFVNLTPSGFCKVAKADAKVSHNPLYEGLVEVFSPNGKTYAKKLEEMRKWANSNCREFGVSQYGKLTRKGKFTQTGKQKVLVNLLKTRGLSRNATVLDVLNSTVDRSFNLVI